MKMKRQVALLVISALLIGLLPMGNATVSKAGQDPTSATEETARAGYGLNNPKTDSNGVTTWDCVWFGNYWQEDTNGDGKTDKNDEKQPIKWRVLSVDGDDAFLLADKNLDCQRYNYDLTGVTWETCTMRSWLNGYGAESNQDSRDYSRNNFLDYAFTSVEQSAILTTNVVNDDNPEYGTEGGNDTFDRVYLLSFDEVINPVFGFPSDYSKYAESRRANSTEYAKAQGVWASPSDKYVGNSVWWLRSPGRSNSSAADVDIDGYVFQYGTSVHNTSVTRVAVRPALHLNLSSVSSWSYAGKVIAEEIETVAPLPTSPSTSYGLNNPAIGDDGVTTWDCVWFGNYWQENTNGNIKDEKQPIKWRVLSVDGDDVFLLADKNLDCQVYNFPSESATWETCDIRSWLNGYGAASNNSGLDYGSNNFLKNAFSESEQSAIRNTNVVNNSNSYFGTEGGNDTLDKVYLLSLEEVVNPAYGFSSDYNKYAESRRVKNTEYVKNRGAYTYTSTGNGNWWLRSPGGSSTYAACVYYHGNVSRNGSPVGDRDKAVRPALHLNLSSVSSWSYAGKITSEGEEIGATIPTPNPETEHSPLPAPPSTVYDLNNPTIDSNGVTTWDCVWFGNYWQEDTNEDGEADKNDAKQPIKWRVLSVDGDDAFLLADKNLDVQRYNDIDADITWEICTMRSWLNGYGAASNKEEKDYTGSNFLDYAFSSEEQLAIRMTKVVNDNSSYPFLMDGGNNTSDRVYLLSIDEVLNSSYGFIPEMDSTKTREAVNTSYVVNGGEIKADYIGVGSMSWWLRSPSIRNGYVSGVDSMGYVSWNGPNVSSIWEAVRPALHLDLSSVSSWSYAGKVTSEGEEIGAMTPTPKPTLEPSVTFAPTEEPEATPIVQPTSNPTVSPGMEHSPLPTAPSVTSVPTEEPEATSIVQPTANPTVSPGMEHSPLPTAPSVTSVPTEEPEATPIVQPTANPTESPGMEHSPLPTAPSATSSPTEKPEVTPTVQPTDSPSVSPAATTEPGGESTMKPTATATVPSTVKPTTTSEAMTPFVPVSPSQTFTLVLQPTASPTVTSVGRVASIKLKQKKQTVTASWKKVTGAAGYQIWYSTSKKWKGKKQKLLRKNKVKVKKLKKKKTYYFRVRAYRLDGTKKVYGAWSKRKKIKMKK